MLRDARIYQILFLALFLTLGIGTRDWTLHPRMILTAIATCLTTQAIATWVVGRVRSQESESEGNIQNSKFTWADSPETKIQNSPEPQPPITNSQSLIPNFPSPGSPSPTPCPLSPTGLLSPLITSLGLSLLLRTEHYSTMVLAGSVAILSKFVLRVQDKHLFNPGNIGIVAAVLLTQDAWISPGQWGEESWYALVFLGAGGIVLQRVGRWDTTVAFLGAYGFLEALRNVWLGWTWDVWAHRLMSGSLLLFALFMVTDPRTIPNDRTARLLWAGAIALLTFVLRNVFFIPTAVFWALFVLSPLTLLLDAVWQAPRFEWRRAVKS
ncbi:MAG: RnfABCDGE type electron transport complex subunit D [Oscillatoriales cyanobacterium C42_A2020_001]|nr:RnfABCDGE type electron transport complex subunit D [Leptolyngbyaceae cyanobacterium C42_A2020_001]